MPPVHYLAWMLYLRSSRVGSWSLSLAPVAGFKLLPGGVRTWRALLNMASWVSEKHCWKVAHVPDAMQFFPLQIMSSITNLRVICGRQILCHILPFIENFLPALCWQKCLYAFCMYIQLSSGLQCYSCSCFIAIWLLGDESECGATEEHSVTFHTTSLTLTSIEVTFWWNITVLHS